jgi:hypothetical protein
VAFALLGMLLAVPLIVLACLLGPQARAAEALADGAGSALRAGRSGPIPPPLQRHQSTTSTR